MKKIILSTIAGLLALTMVGCSSSSQDTAIKNMSSQLDRVNNAVSSISDNQMQALSSNSYINSQSYYNNNLNFYNANAINQQGFVASQMSQVQKSVYEQTSLKQTLLSQVAMLKSSMAQNLKLSKSQIKALTGLTNNISQYVSNLNGTKNDIASAIKQIRKYNSVSTYNIDLLGAYYQSLNTHLNSRICYMKNLIDSIDQAEKIVLGNYNSNEGYNGEYNIVPSPNEPGVFYFTDNTTYNFSQNTNPSQSNNDIAKTSTNSDTTKTNKESKKVKNIDTYKPVPTIKQPENNGNNMNNINNGYNNSRINNGYYGYNGYNGYNGFNGYNGYNEYNVGFNPNRNTDTYAPRISNIDTYRNYPGGGFNSNVPMNRRMIVPASAELDENEQTENVENDANQKQEKDIEQEKNIEKTYSKKEKEIDKNCSKKDIDKIKAYKHRLNHGSIELSKVRNFPKTQEVKEGF